MGITFSVFGNSYDRGYRGTGNPIIAGGFVSLFGMVLMFVGFLTFRQGGQYTNGTTVTVTSVDTTRCSSYISNNRSVTVCPVTVEYTVSGKKYVRDMTIDSPYVGKTVKVSYNAKDPSVIVEGDILGYKLIGPAMASWGLVMILTALCLAFGGGESSY